MENNISSKGSWNQIERTKYEFKHPFLLIIRGLPGSGKTYFAELLKKKISSQTVVLNPDKIDLREKEYIQFSNDLLNNEPTLGKEIHPYRFLLSTAIEVLMKDGVVIWDQPFSNTRGLIKTVEKAKFLTEGKKTKTLIVELDVEPEIAWSRITKRKDDGGHGPCKERFLKFSEEYTPYVGDDLVVVRVNNGVKEPDLSCVMETMQKLDV